MFFVVGAKNQQHHKVERGTHNKDCFTVPSESRQQQHVDVGL